MLLSADTAIVPRIVGTTDSKRSTAERILDAAERLVSERGFRQTSTRAIIEEAGANVAAVNYHFGSKTGLLEAVIARVLEPLRSERTRRLEDLLERESDATLEELIDAFVSPAIVRAVERRSSPARVIGHIFAEEEGAMYRVMREYLAVVDDRFRVAMSALTGHLGPAEFEWRFLCMAGLMSHTQVRAGAAAHAGAQTGQDETIDVETFRRRLVTFLAAGMRAPASDPSLRAPS